ncbi:hypothetical protein F4777DRAFT_563185 [Nemania sp. FL0916]|nr:hypothetical protein F4777DRAFT_563185 [Nemania sp. FL0916]
MNLSVAECHQHLAACCRRNSARAQKHPAASVAGMHLQLRSRYFTVRFSLFGAAAVLVRTYVGIRRRLLAVGLAVGSVPHCLTLLGKAGFPSCRLLHRPRI